ncbi:hypothetical protein NC651_032169 [Populus alba x Populus x berolinensis]|nr:hypothetical protein NC651_032169 [Populus alba x Populus x berolinensis]
MFSSCEFYLQNQQEHQNIIFLESSSRSILRSSFSVAHEITRQAQIHLLSC